MLEIWEMDEKVTILDKYQERTARKEYRCIYCNAIISKGQNYVHIKEFFLSSKTTVYRHACLNHFNCKCVHEEDSCLVCSGELKFKGGEEC